MLTSIIAAVVILAVLIVVHEAGHFVMAKRCGVRVLRFSIGYPPKVWSFRRGETEYALSATPLGGYVRMLGDEIGDEPGLGDSETLLKETGLDLFVRGQGRGLPDRGSGFRWRTSCAGSSRGACDRRSEERCDLRPPAESARIDAAFRNRTGRVGTGRDQGDRSQTPA